MNENMMSDAISLNIEYMGGIRAGADLSGLMSESVWNVSRHNNADFEIHLILSGSCGFSCGKKEYLLCCDDIVLIAPGSYHSSESASPLCHLAISLLPSEPKTALRLLELSEKHPVKKLDNNTRSMLKLMWDEYMEYGGRKTLLMEQLFSGAVIMLLRLFGTDEKNAARADHGGSGGRESDITADDREIRSGIIDDYFEKHYMDNGGAKALSDMLSLSRRQLFRILNEKYRQSYSEKLLSHRMDRASRLLETTKLSVSEIAAATGYSSESAFYHKFKSFFNMTPGEYRQSVTSPQCKEKGKA